ncbi:DUF2849 domain-containing protein [Sneathiella chinensis]|uniref:DUF2849 domain-containing protein n=1 Tax=Sneathiella chinensis TaxID=349750 RepID=A0ABQ5UA30_9PROT|nr:DUF2849 domain-containing protein [Sneathiella chinensis]GLQ08035.1 hypothetical protein GCM10007924_32570 [Sneathiella chinensis]
MALQVYTASLLKEGLVAYLCLDGDTPFWTTDLNKATAAPADALHTLKSEAEKAARENIIVEPYAVDVTVTEGGIVPATKREQIRASGPTIRLPQARSATADAQHAA